MSHYDCSDCGSYLGVSYGSCNSCTPAEVKTAERELTAARTAARQRYQETRREEEQQYVEQSCAKELCHYNELYERHKPK